MNGYNLTSRYIIDLMLRPEAPLHIGTGEKLLEKGVLTMQVYGRRLPIIPSQSIKGVMRSLATRIAKNTEFDSEKVKGVVKRHEKDQHKEILSKIGEGEVKESLLKLFSEEYVDRMFKELEIREIKELAVSLSCPICLLFGSRHYAGKILFFDTIPVNDRGEIIYPRIETRAGIAISRKTRTVEEKRLYTIEYITTGEDLFFKTRMVADNITKGRPEAKLFVKLLKYIDKNGMVLGGLKSKGFGKVEVKMEVKKMNFKKPKDENDEKTILANVRALLLKDNVEEMSIKKLEEELCI